jgi:hypothetical protein
MGFDFKTHPSHFARHPPLTKGGLQNQNKISVLDLPFLPASGGSREEGTPWEVGFNQKPRLSTGLFYDLRSKIYDLTSLLLLPLACIDKVEIIFHFRRRLGLQPIWQSVLGKVSKTHS